MVGYGSYETVIDVLEQALAGRSFIAGDGFTAADVCLGAQIGWGMEYGTIENRQAFVRYWSGLSAPPGLAPRPRDRQRHAGRRRVVTCRSPRVATVSGARS